jgi:hypothetical protein
MGPSPALPVARTRSGDWLFWLTWVATGAAAILLSFGAIYASIPIAKAVIPDFNEDRVMGALLFPIMGTVLGVVQWLVLRRRIPVSAWWIVATAVGIGSIGVLARGIALATIRATGQEWSWDSTPHLLALSAFVGLVLALIQLPVLWRHTRGWAWWLLAGIVGWIALGLIMGKSIDTVTDIIALGAVPAAFTGLYLIWLRTRQE